MKNLEFLFLGEILIIRHLLFIENLENEGFWPAINEHIQLYGGNVVSQQKGWLQSVSTSLRQACRAKGLPSAPLLFAYPSPAPLCANCTERFQGTSQDSATCEYDWSFLTCYRNKAEICTLVVQGKAMSQWQVISPRALYMPVSKDLRLVRVSRSNKHLRRCHISLL